ncbi:MAG: GNAT family N-acetyltransferase [Acidobacteriia bacterium]|nr:GNAT family N-acetyltransferase [Terriglobia bacterium]
MIETPRLLLRRWKDCDREPFSRINSDPRVMEFFPACLTREQSDSTIERIEAHFEEHGFGLFAAEIRSSGELAGFVGVMVPAFEAYFTPCVEIGWRLGAAYWNEGLATEGARAVMQHAFAALGLRELVSFAVLANMRSLRVMEKLGMTHDGEFDHPGLPEGHPLRRHVLYRKAAARVPGTSSGLDKWCSA